MNPLELLVSRPELGVLTARRLGLAWDLVVGPQGAAPFRENISLQSRLARHFRRRRWIESLSLEDVCEAPAGFSKRARMIV